MMMSYSKVVSWNRQFQAGDATLNGHNGGAAKGILLIGQEYKGHTFDISLSPCTTAIDGHLML
jgi:hypothetical protein